MKKELIDKNKIKKVNYYKIMNNHILNDHMIIKEYIDGNNNCGEIFRNDPVKIKLYKRGSMNKSNKAKICICLRI